MASAPEKTDYGMNIKPSCECSECEHWINSVDWTPKNITEKHENVIQHKKVLQPFFHSAEHKRSPPHILNCIKDNLTKIEKQQSLKVLVHCNKIALSPINSVCDAHFAEEIQLSLKNLEYKFSKPIQSYVWPALFRELNVFVIGNPKCGKTLAYLPAVCSFAVDDHPLYLELEKQYKGPLVVIVCPNSKQCEEVYDLIEKLYQTINPQDRPKTVMMTYPFVKVGKVDILITLPSTLMECLHSDIFSLKRMCHLIFENANILLQRHREAINQILNVVGDVTEHRLTPKKIQLILTSEEWMTDIESLLQKMYSVPVISIENHLETALYGNVDFEINFRSSFYKTDYLIEAIKDGYKTNKTLIICANDEIVELNKELVRKGMITFCLSDAADKDDIIQYEMRWSTAPCGDYKVLLCTDFIFESFLTINDAMWLVHFSFPATWTRFTKRFSALLRHINSPLERSKEYIQCRTFLLIDESCEYQMNKIILLLKRLNQELPEQYKTYAKSFKLQNEKKKIDEGSDLCNHVKLLGSCYNGLCPKRHLVQESCDVSKYLPTSGKIKFKILSLHNVTSYAIQVLEHQDVDGQIHKFCDDNLKKPLDYRGHRPEVASDFKIGKFYAHCTHGYDGATFILCELLQLKENNFVEVCLKSTGQIMQTQKNKLYKVPSHIKIVEMYLCNLVPPHNDEYFSDRSFSITKSSLIEVNYKKKIFSGDVRLQLNDTLWLDNVTEMIKVSGIDMVKFTLSKHLQTKEVVAVSLKQMESLYKLCESCNVKIPTGFKQKTKTVKKKSGVKPQWAFLDDSVTQVVLSSGVSPDEFYVRIAKFQSLLNNLEKTIQDSLTIETFAKKIEINVGKYYLALDPSGGQYARARIVKKDKNKCLCFFVDYGDEAVVDMSCIKVLPAKFITKLPFQAIHCSLHGISPILQNWDNSDIDILYKYMFEPDSDIYRSLFVKVHSSDKTDNIRTKTKYSVVLKDGFNAKNGTINHLLIDCGLARALKGEEIENFDLPSEKENESDDDLDTASDFEIGEENMDDLSKPIAADIVSIPPESTDFNEEGFDMEIFDAECFFKDLGMRCKVEPKATSNRQIQAIDYMSQNHNPSKAAETSAENDDDRKNNLTPEVYWSQTKDAVIIKIKLIDAQEYKVNILQRRIFIFWAKVDEKVYELKFPLFKPAEIVRHSNKGMEIVVVMKKKDEEDWTQLTSTEKRLRYVHYEILDQETKETKRKFLQLDISDDESDGEDDNVLYVNTSDLESDYDEEIQSDEE